MSRKSLWLFLILAVVAAGLLLQPATRAQKQKQQKYQASSGPPSLSLNVEPAVVKACEGGTQVQLVANAKSPDGAPLRYRWQVNGGQIKGDGPNTTWARASQARSVADTANATASASTIRPERPR